MVGQIADSRRAACKLMPMVLRLAYTAEFDWDAALQFFGPKVHSVTEDAALGVIAGFDEFQCFALG